MDRHAWTSGREVSEKREILGRLREWFSAATDARDQLLVVARGVDEISLPGFELVATVAAAAPGEHLDLGASHSEIRLLD